MARQEDRRRATSDELRAEIDSGRTGEKVATGDPAAAPLGTDDEAAGRPTDPQTLRALQERERAKAPSRRPEVADAPRARREGISLVPLAVVTLLFALILAIFLANGLL